MDRADLAQKARAKRGQYSVGLDQNAPETVGELRIKTGMLTVILKPDRCSISQGMVQVRTSRPSERIRLINSVWKSATDRGHRAKPSRLPSTLIRWPYSIKSRSI